MTRQQAPGNSASSGGGSAGSRGKSQATPVVPCARLLQSEAGRPSIAGCGVGFSRVQGSDREVCARLASGRVPDEKSQDAPLSSEGLPVASRSEVGGVAPRGGGASLHRKRRRVSESSSEDGDSSEGTSEHGESPMEIAYSPGPLVVRDRFSRT